MSSQVPSARTPWELDELLASLDRAFTVLVGVRPSARALSILAGQATIETGRKGSGCWNWNVSNIMGVSPEGMFHVLHAAPECAPADKVPAGATVVQDTNVSCPPGHVAFLPPGGSRFRAYSRLETACEDKVAVLLGLWPRAVDALVRDDLELRELARAFVGALKRPIARADYFSADAAPYARSVGSIAAEYLAQAEALIERRTMPSPPMPTPPMPTPTLQANVPTEGVVLEDFLATLADDAPKA